MQYANTLQKTAGIYYDFRFLLAEFCSDADEVTFSEILPFVSRNVALHPEHAHETIDRLKDTLQHLTNTLLIED